MKCLSVVLLAGALVGLGSTAARAQDAEKPERREPPQHRERPRDRDKEEPIVDVAAESASHEEVEPLAIEFGRLTALRLHTNGNLLACDAQSQQIKVINPAGELVATVELGFAPEAIDVAADGIIYCGGQGKLAKLDPNGAVLEMVELPKKDGPPQTENKDAPAAKTKKPRDRARENRVSGIAVTDRDLFVAYGAGWSLRSLSKLFRFTLDLENPQIIAEDLRGCCQRCDIVARDGVVYVAENARYRVVSFNREGEVLAKWGAKNRKGLEGFGACCNPMNLCFDAEGVLYTAESGLGRVKRYSTDGKLLGQVGYAGTTRFSNAGGLAASCSNIAIAVTPDGDRVYVMDYKDNRIRVLQKKS